MRTLFAVGVVAALAWGTVPAGADAPRQPSLGEIAAREKDKKKGKPITEEDLRSRRKGGTVSQPNADGGSATAASPAPGAAGDKKAGAATAAADKPKTEDEVREEAQTAWREKLTQAQSDVTNFTAEVARLQTALNDTSGPLYGPGRAARVEALENAKRQLATATTTVETLQEEGRRNRYR
ncbi:MAG TPA: hypothetical protein VEQ84_10045 [Vicinamibacteria bacterium]|nr:hypothetical protein [Vicinamibacteria bacterium]